VPAPVVASAPRDAERVRAACAFIRAHVDHPPTLARLAEQAGLSRFHFQRTFRAVMGVTPKQFAEACRLQRFKGGLRARTRVTDAIYDAGYGSGSRVYERAGSQLGMTPGQYRDGGLDVRITYACAASPLGRLMVAATDRGVCFVQFGDSDEGLRRMLRDEYPRAHLEPMRTPRPRQFAAWMTAVRDQLRGRAPRHDLPLDLRATAFQLKVWTHLQTIPSGQVASYADVAAAIGRPGAARAVARACAANRVAVVVPCHRVIRGTGDLGGYRWGTERKRALLDREREGRNLGSHGRELRPGQSRRAAAE
jgi:AraC family transcriptional regulator of adaptative response/methylated-DNA-[protein]-cysteine methyltransferase